MVYKVRSTSVKNRKKVKHDYIIAMNSKVKRVNGIKRYAVVKYLFKYNSPKGNEWRTMVAFGRVVIDASLDDDEVALDQTIRNALGMEFDKFLDYEVKIFTLKQSLRQKILSYLRPGQFLYLRVNYPALNDMEKNICRISPNSAKLLNSNDGNSVWVECCRSDYRRDIMEVFNEVVYDRYRYISEADAKNTLKKYFDGVKLDEDIYSDHLVDDKKDVEFIYALLDRIKECDGRSDEGFLKYKRVLHNIVSYGEWLDEGKYTLIDRIIPAYVYDSETEQEIAEYQKTEDSCKSFEARYPDSDHIFKMQPDLETIRLDKYYRDLFNLNVLDSVKVKRRFLESIRDDLIEYGMVFVLTILAVVAAVNPQNSKIMSVAVVFSVIFTIIIMIIRNY